MEGITTVYSVVHPTATAVGRAAAITRALILSTAMRSIAIRRPILAWHRGGCIRGRQSQSSRTDVWSAINSPRALTPRCCSAAPGRRPPAAHRRASSCCDRAARPRSGRHRDRESADLTIPAVSRRPNPQLRDSQVSAAASFLGWALPIRDLLAGARRGALLRRTCVTSTRHGSSFAARQVAGVVEGNQPRARVDPWIVVIVQFATLMCQ